MMQMYIFLSLLYFITLHPQEHITSAYVGHPLITTICNLVQNDALESLSSGKLKCLDAQVGDFQCHGRAGHILELHNKTLDETFTPESLTPIDKRFLSLCYLLTISKKTAKIGLRTIREVIDESLLKKKFAIGTKKASRIKRYAQEELACITISCIIEQTKRHIPELLPCMEIIPSCDQVFNRPSLPHLPSVVVMLKQIMSQSIPLRVTINELCNTCARHEHLLELLFMHRQDLSTYECVHSSIDQYDQIPFELLSPHKACMHAHFFNPEEIPSRGQSEEKCQYSEDFIHNILQHPIEKILISSASAYPCHIKQETDNDIIPIIHDAVIEHIGTRSLKKKSPALILQHIKAESLEEIKAMQGDKTQMLSSAHE